MAAGRCGPKAARLDEPESVFQMRAALSGRLDAAAGTASEAEEEQPEEAVQGAFVQRAEDEEEEGAAPG